MAAFYSAADCYHVPHQFSLGQRTQDPLIFPYWSYLIIFNVFSRLSPITYTFFKSNTQAWDRLQLSFTEAALSRQVNALLCPKYPVVAMGNSEQE